MTLSLSSYLMYMMRIVLFFIVSFFDVLKDLFAQLTLAYSTFVLRNKKGTVENHHITYFTKWLFICFYSSCILFIAMDYCFFSFLFSHYILYKIQIIFHAFLRDAIVNLSLKLKIILLSYCFCVCVCGFFFVFLYMLFYEPNIQVTNNFKNLLS